MLTVVVPLFIFLIRSTHQLIRTEGSVTELKGFPLADDTSHYQPKHQPTHKPPPHISTSINPIKRLTQINNWNNCLISLLEPIRRFPLSTSSSFSFTLDFFVYILYSSSISDSVAQQICYHYHSLGDLI